MNHPTDGNDRPAPAADAVLREFIAGLKRRDKRPGGRGQTREQAAAARSAQEEDFGEAAREVSRADDLVARFISEARSAGCGVHDARHADWLAILREVLREHNVEAVYLDATVMVIGGEECGARLADALRASGLTVTSAMDKATFFDVDAAITGVAGAVAETGSLIWASSETAPRSATLAPPVHIALVRGEQILPDLVDYFALLSEGPPLPANINLITGPSKTADIESTLVTGVHGPGHVEIILLDA